MQATVTILGGLEITVEFKACRAEPDVGLMLDYFEDWSIVEIVAAGANGMFVPESVYAPLVEAGLVEINPAMADDNGYVATRAKQALYTIEARA